MCIGVEFFSFLSLTLRAGMFFALRDRHPKRSDSDSIYNFIVLFWSAAPFGDTKNFPVSRFFAARTRNCFLILVLNCRQQKMRSNAANSRRGFDEQRRRNQKRDIAVHLREKLHLNNSGLGSPKRKLKRLIKFYRFSCCSWRITRHQATQFAPHDEIDTCFAANCIINLIAKFLKSIAIARSTFCSISA